MSKKDDLTPQVENSGTDLRPVETVESTENRDFPSSGFQVALGNQTLLEILVQNWFRDWFPNSPVARGDTQAWNHLVQAVADLKQRLKGV